ncbi:D-aminopeptidase [Neoasaia chiangmaiensis NBRC 101099]|uniref:Aminopeptidase n=1 Tax=Neoasaia chiangmaiensis TaxID=320497 RepID=A0A1U9KPY4_9PROT|nr:D-aminopeptidase [Neoasaia chiangmaiensis]AQS87891.1 aminopeptidase [Neoasaia chiangmaiensis]GBR39167.1 D-aminopeptidase [Neoasaia chiangmaiensis NBRC 101099]GEN15538.1 D-aminopeptidase [Neoasaia chiangmaiensis]
MTTQHIEETLSALPRRYPGPGGGAAIVRDGQVLARHSWGFANAETRRPFTPATLFRMCSITKQFACALLLDAFPDPTVLDRDVAARLPNLTEAPPGMLHLAHNQSGLRDYWAVAMLHGAPVESVFGDVEAEKVIRGTRSLHFRPGTAYSYVNQNFRLISDIVQDRLGRSFAELLQERIFDRHGMRRAFLAADTRAMPDGTTGYEGSEATGYRAAENNIFWTGDAGLGASLDDMIAWEQAIDAQRDDPEGFYNRMSAPVAFADGAPARYGFGLARSMPFGRAATGHGGALRGWRSHRLHIASARLSVVVMFNHMSDAQGAALELAAAALGEAGPPAPVHGESRLPGIWFEPETGLAVPIDEAASRLRMRYAYPPEMLDRTSAETAGRDATRLKLDGRDDTLTMARPQENRVTTLQRRTPGEGRHDVAGRYRCDELDAELTVINAGGSLYGGFSGMLGIGRMERLQPLAEDLWLLPCLRALDHSPPGHWTLAFARDENGVVIQTRVGCWLARDLSYRRLPD